MGSSGIDEVRYTFLPMFLGQTQFEKIGCQKYSEWGGQDLLRVLSPGPLFVVTWTQPCLPTKHNDMEEANAQLPLI